MMSWMHQRHASQTPDPPQWTSLSANARNSPSGNHTPGSNAHRPKSQLSQHRGSNSESRNRLYLSRLISPSVRSRPEFDDCRAISCAGPLVRLQSPHRTGLNTSPKVHGRLSDRPAVGPPPLHQGMFDPQLIGDPRHNKVDQIGNRPGAMIKTRHRGQHCRPRLRELPQILQLNA